MRSARSRRSSGISAVGYEGATHGFFNPFTYGGKFYEETLREPEQFLMKIGYLPASSSNVTR